MSFFPSVNMMSGTMQIWSNAKCHNAEGHPYWSEESNSALIDKLQPAAEYSWRHLYSPDEAAGRLAGGVLLHEWLQALSTSAEEAAGCTVGSEEWKDPDVCKGVRLTGIFSAVLLTSSCPCSLMGHLQ
jgi:hypothetical protein